MFNMDENRSIIAYTDGGCALNPGGPGGYGVIIIDNDKETEYSQGYISTTNNRMEVMALIRALKETEGAITMYSDSQYAVKTATGEWGGSKNPDLWEEYYRLARGRNVTVKWIRGHSGNKYNERCDILATTAIHSPEKIADTGYADAIPQGILNDNRTEGYGAPKIDIPAHMLDIPEKLNNIPHIISCNEYAQEYNVNEACADTIIDFYNDASTSFSAYVRLKTGGWDQWSNSPKNHIINHVGLEATEIAQNAFSDEKDVLSCLRWRCRGLAMKDAIKKVQVDKEVTRNYNLAH